MNNVCMVKLFYYLVTVNFSTDFESALSAYLHSQELRFPNVSFFNKYFILARGLHKGAIICENHFT